MTQESALALAAIGASSEPLPVRAEALLRELERSVPFDSARIALADPFGCGYSSLAAVALDAPTLAYLSGPQTAHDIELAGADRLRPPLSPSDLPFPAEDLPTWAECLIPAGYHEALAVSLFGPGHRHIGLVTLLSAGSAPPSDVVRDRLESLTPLLAEAVDPMRSVLAVARIVQHAVAGVVLAGDHGVEPLPGFVDDALLVAGSPTVLAARRALQDDRLQATFLWPVGPDRPHHGYVRVTALNGPDLLGTGFAGLVVLSAPGPLRGLTARELEVLGLVVEGCSNQEIAAALVVTPRTAAAHIEHILAKLEAPSRTLAAVRAERSGLYVPSTPRPG